VLAAALVGVAVVAWPGHVDRSPAEAGTTVSPAPMAQAVPPTEAKAPEATDGVQAAPSLEQAAQAEQVAEAPASAPVVQAASAEPASGATATAVQSDEGDAASASAAPEATGVVRLDVSPWGEVWVDGRSQGVTPPTRQLNLPIGRHAIVLRNGDLPPYQQTIEVKAGKPVRVYHQF
jgi:hypothetical protein